MEGAVLCCPQQAWISRPSSSTGKRTTSRIGGGFSSSGGLRPSAVRMRFTEISSLTYATTFSFPPHWRQTSGSAWYTLLMSLAQLGGQRRLVVDSLLVLGRDGLAHVRREARMAPREELPDEILRDRVALDEASQKTLAEQLHHRVTVPRRERVKRAIVREGTVGHEDVSMSQKTLASLLTRS